MDRHAAEGRLSHPAIRSEGRTLSYGDVLANVNRTGNALRRLGVRRGDRVRLVLLDGPEFVYAFFGAFKIGAVAVPINTLFTPRDHAYVSTDSGARVAIVSESLVPALAGAGSTDVPLIVVGQPGAGAIGFAELVAAESAELAPEPTPADGAAFWLYTSGTTGLPVAAIHRQRDVFVCHQGFGRAVLEITEADSTFSVAKLFFAYGLGNSLYHPFAVGASTVLYPGRPEPRQVFEIIARERPTLLFSVPTSFAALLRVAEADGIRDLGAVRRCVSAGEALPVGIYERWRARFGLELLDGLGSTELCHTFISNRAGRVRPGSSGTLVSGYDARIVDDVGTEVADDVVGDLLVRGASACASYWNDDTRTRRTFDGEWVRTGDRYSRDRDGYFWYTGRTDDMMKAGGMWVSPVEVEAVLLEHTAVLEAGVVGVPNAEELVKPVAFIVLAPGHAATPELEEELRDFVRQRLAPYKHPRRVIFLAELPKTATGKVQRFKLREQARGLA